MLYGTEALLQNFCAGSTYMSSQLHPHHWHCPQKLIMPNKMLSLKDRYRHLSSSTFTNKIFPYHFQEIYIHTRCNDYVLTKDYEGLKGISIPKYGNTCVRIKPSIFYLPYFILICILFLTLLWIKRLLTRVA